MYWKNFAITYSNTTFYNINKKEQIHSFLDTKIKESEKEVDNILSKLPVEKWTKFLEHINHNS